MSNASKRTEEEEAAIVERRRALQARIEVDNEHGRQLIERYEREAPRPGFANVAYDPMKRRRR